MLRTPLASERIQMTDPITGIKVIQITSYPTPSNPLAYDWPSVTPDNQRVFFQAQRHTARDATWDLWRCDTDGLNLFQLTEREPAGEVAMRLDGTAHRPLARLTLDGSALFAHWHGDEWLYRIDAETGADEAIADLSAYTRDGCTLQGFFIISDDRLLVGRRDAKGQRSWLRLTPASGHVDELALDAGVLGFDFVRDRIIVLLNPYEIDLKATPDGSRVYANVNETPMSAWTCDIDGGDLRFLSPWVYAHGTPLGHTGAMHGPGHPPDKCVYVTREGSDPEKVAEGPYFWHSGASFDGEWVISDTNWPDEGLKIVHVPSKRWRTLCHAHATQGHTQMGHPHSGLSQDGCIAVFGSDRTGVRQVYVAHITDEFRESVMAGHLDNATDKWM